MIIDKNGKLFGKVNIIDILVVAVLLGAVAGAVYKFAKAGTTGILSKPDKVRIVIYCPEYPEYAAGEENIKEGSLVKDAVQGITLGTVTGVEIGEAVGYAVSDEGEFVTSSKPDHVSVSITVEGYGRYTENGLVINNVEYYVGQSIDKLRVGKSDFRYFSPRIFKIEKIG
ncbi:MAG: DUF4330 domain-containing protein [Bacillota bacterium]